MSGDPEPLDYAASAVRQLLGRVPVFSICLGHQILAQALGAKTCKLKFGHHGANHPVLHLATGHEEITSQNHGFCTDADSPAGKNVKLAHINLNGNTIEGLKSVDKKAFSVQYHPEAAPGPHGSRYLFDLHPDDGRLILSRSNGV